MSDNHHSSLLRPGRFPVRHLEDGDRFDPYWNIEVCTQCEGSGQEASGVEYMGISEMLGCEACYGIGYMNEEIGRLIDILTEGGL